MPVAERAEAGEDSRALDDDELATLVVPAPDPLATDQVWLDRVTALAPAHARVLDGLADYYRD